MPEDEREFATEPGQGEGGGPPRTPFDRLAFLPALLWLFVLWFGYDAFFDTETGREYPLFNRYGFGFVLFAAIYFTIDAIRAIPFGMAVLFWAYAIWLGYMGWIGEGWYSEATATVRFNQYGAGAMGGVALVFTLRAWSARRRAEASPGVGV